MTLTKSIEAMTEDEIREKICRILHCQAYCNDKVDEQWTDFEDDANDIIRALKAANVLFVSED